jgi:hypothetical protein
LRLVRLQTLWHAFETCHWCSRDNMAGAKLGAPLQSCVLHTLLAFRGFWPDLPCACLCAIVCSCMSSVDQQMTSSDPVLLGANPMQSMDLGTGKHASAGVHISCCELRSLCCPLYHRQQYHNTSRDTPQKILSRHARPSSSGCARGGG